MPCLAAVLCILGSSGCRSVPEKLFFRPNGTRTVVYKTTPEKLSITVYPRPTTPVRGAIIFFHGGGWQAGGSDLPLYADLHYPLSDAGLQAFSVEHRTAPEYRGRELLQDCMDAIIFIQSRSREFDIPPNRISLMGYSSGGHLAVLSALILSKNRHSRVARSLSSVVAYYAPLDPASLVYYKDDRLKGLLDSYLPEYNEGLLEKLGIRSVQNDPRETRRRFFEMSLQEVAPIDHLHAGMPPILLIHGRRDKLVPDTQSINFAMHAERFYPGKVKLRLIDDADHNFIRHRKSWVHKTQREALLFVLTTMAE